MKKFLIVLFGVSVLSLSVWQSRLDLLIWAAPTVINTLQPTAPNRPIVWQQGPTKAILPPSERPPNIILILADDLGFNDISLYNGGAGDGSVMTPNIDKIAAQGVVFENGYAANAICAPSRATLLTGRYSTRFGFEYTPIFKLGPRIFQWMEELEPGPLPLLVDTDAAAELPSIQDLGMPSEEITIAEVLKDKGYYTAHIGKWHVGSNGDKRPQAQGFDESLDMRGGLYMPEDHPDVVNAKVEGAAIDRMIWATGRYAVQFNSSENFEPDGYLTDYFTNEAVKVIDANKNRPFFLYLAQWGVHNPLQAAKADYEALSHIKDHRMRVYSAMIRALDRSVEKVTKALEKNGLAENTLIIFTSDNGGAGYIGLADINKPYRGWKLTHFEGGTHVPFMVKWPKKIAPGVHMSAPIHHFDLFHTIAAAANATVPSDRTLDGVDLLPFINKEVSGDPHKTLFWRQGYQQTVLHEGWKMIRTKQPDKGSDAPNKKFLFHLDSDPTEQINLINQHPEKLILLEQLLAQHNEEQIESAWPSTTQSPQPIDKHGDQAYEQGDEVTYWPN
ncbi:MAG: arylsulfatase A-like enzyme [Arenicella sp.]|jgi:arylsulfatase A-like enzyme